MRALNRLAVGVLQVAGGRSHAPRGIHVRPLAGSGGTEVFSFGSRRFGSGFAEKEELESSREELKKKREDEELEKKNEDQKMKKIKEEEMLMMELLKEEEELLEKEEEEKMKKIKEEEMRALNRLAVGVLQVAGGRAHAPRGIHVRPLAGSGGTEVFSFGSRRFGSGFAEKEELESSREELKKKREDEELEKKNEEENMEKIKEEEMLMMELLKEEEELLEKEEEEKMKKKKEGELLSMEKEEEKKLKKIEKGELLSKEEVEKLKKEEKKKKYEEKLKKKKEEKSKIKEEKAHRRSTRVYRCRFPGCDETRSSAEGITRHHMKKHQKKHHPTDLPCEYCGNCYGGKTLLKEHHPECEFLPLQPPSSPEDNKNAKNKAKGKKKK